jgi:Rad3-related DNA helicase
MYFKYLFFLGFVPDGVVIFFPSYLFLNICLDEWSNKRNKMEVTYLESLSETKKLFFEKKGENQEELLREYRKEIDSTWKVIIVVLSHFFCLFRIVYIVDPFCFVLLVGR